MAVVGIAKEVHANRAGSLSADGNGTIVRTFLVRTDDPENDTFFTVYQAPGLPQLWDTHPFTPVFTVSKVSGALVETPGTAWHCTVEYGTQVPQEQQQDQFYTQVEFDVVKTQHAVRRDLNGIAIKNSAGSPFDPPIEVPRSHWTVRFTRREPTYNPDISDDYTDKVNSATFLGKDAGYIKCNSIRAGNEVRDGVRWWNVTYEFEHNPDGWVQRVLDAGYEFLDSGVKYRIKDGNDQDITTPWPLDGSGAKLSQSDINNDLEVYLPFTIFGSADFNALGLSING